MFRFAPTLWTVSVLLAAGLRTSHGGQPRVIGSQQPIVAAVGDDVVLPCHLEPSQTVESYTVEWSMPDLKPDPLDRLGRVAYVHLYRHRSEIKDMKMKSYVGRTALFMDGLKHGNISLKILNVTLEDGGRYRCIIPRLKSDVKESIVELVVVSVQTWTTTTNLTNLQTEEPKKETDRKGVLPPSVQIAVTAAVVVFVLLILLAAFRCQRREHPKYNLSMSTSPPA